MNNDERHATTTGRWLSVFMLAFLPWLTACADSTQLPKPPLSLPFTIQKAGNKVETGLRLDEERYYSFSLRLYYRENDEEDRKRVRKLVGDATLGVNGKFIEPGIPIPLRLKINLVDLATGERTIVEKKISELELWEHGNGYFSKLVYAAKLKPGGYRISVESVKDMPELEGIPVTFEIAFGHFK